MTGYSALVENTPPKKNTTLSSFGVSKVAKHGSFGTNVIFRASFEKVVKRRLSNSPGKLMPVTLSK
jgi:hypothetical protein